MSDETTKREETPTQTGNTAALREALETVVGALCHLCLCGSTCENDPRGWCAEVSKAKAALATPPRNCDMFPTWEKAAEAWGKSPEWSECPDAGWAWLFDPAAQEGGKA